MGGLLRTQAIYAAAVAGAVIVAAVSGWYTLVVNARPTVLRVAVGGQGGNIDKLMSEVEALVATQSSAIRLQVVHTDGSATNARLVAEGAAELGAVQADILTAPNVRLVASLAREHFQLVTRRSAGIASLRDLEGKRLALPPEGTSGHQNFHAAAAHHELPLERIAVRAGPVADGLAALERGEVDAVAFVRALRDPGTLDVMRRLQARGDGIEFVPVPQAAALRLQRPYIAETTIAQGSYQGFPPIPAEPVPTLGVSINLVANEIVPEHAVEELARILFQEQLRLIFRTPLAADLERPARGGPSLPLHDGARNYYEGSKPFFLMQHRDIITFTISMTTLAYSLIMMLRARVRNRRKVRVSAYNEELMRIAAAAQDASDVVSLRGCRADLNKLIQQVMRDFAEERISDQGFHVFSLSWEAVRTSVSEALVDAKLRDPGGPVLNLVST